MAFLEDPRLRQRWNQITHDAEAVTENAAAGIWSFQQHYINPCLGYLSHSAEQCTAVCLGDPDERMRRRRERERGGAGAEYSFDFYDDWYGQDDAQDGGAGAGFFGSWAGEDWDRLLAGSGSQRKHLGGEGATAEQPRRKRGMSYGTRGTRRKASEHDPTIIPSTQPIGFLSKLPWKMGGTLRYKPSAADLQDNPGKHEVLETAPLLGSDDESDYGQLIVSRKRSGTTGSGGTGGTSDSYRSRGDLFPSDGEGEEDAVVLDDDVTYDMVRNDRSSAKSDKTRSSKGKRPAKGEGFFASRTLSRTTIASNSSADTMPLRRSISSLAISPAVERVPSLQDLQLEEDRLRDEEEQYIAHRKEAAAQLATQLGLSPTDTDTYSIAESKRLPSTGDEPIPLPTHESLRQPLEMASDVTSEEQHKFKPRQDSQTTPQEFVPARLPHFGS
ncbi:hypothetical protein ISF_01446 [Cordyceps fumosorosea ARSEF 2679]|uniref:Uncharacterized protein n=1 Tax=Cordyceps fumosorosea (strain ARSEF 2679) TaxID=1081104 RepID=A0A168DAT4_CORFA|nr:hypothetical protein ISF_01446 [Cordyceps fumosorosea ARSEF 2679]OAA72373.1 hypothetical protein ISF_01446 [Cordyceps fumosorosea ARSEF 2679]